MPAETNRRSVAGFYTIYKDEVHNNIKGKCRASARLRHPRRQKKLKERAREMCTAIDFFSGKNYFGRNLDLEITYGQHPVITPSGYPFQFRKMGTIEKHPAIMGMAIVMDGFPLYFEGANDKGIGAAGLNFPGNAYYHECKEGKDNIASFEVVPWILCNCSTMDEVKALVKKMNVADIDFSPEMPSSTLHWMVSDGKESIVLESVKDGLKVYDDPVGVMTNNPTFDKQLFNLNNYRKLSAADPEDTFGDGYSLDKYSRGMGTDGMPGGMSSEERFVKCTFTKLNSPKYDDENDAVGQFFHILHSVEQQKGCCQVAPGAFEYTIYSCCINMDDMIYYYTTYDNNQITGVRMSDYDVTGRDLIEVPIVEKQQILFQEH